jgi:hypothetical protein
MRQSDRPSDAGFTPTFPLPSDIMLNLFQSDLNPEVFGFTRDATGQNLPDKFAPWRKSSKGGALYLGVGESSAQLGSDDPVIRAVQTQGFYLIGAPSRRPMDRWKRQWHNAG